MKTIAILSGSVIALTLAAAINTAYGRDEAPAIGVTWTCSQELDAYAHVSCIPQRATADNPNTPAAALREGDTPPAAHGHDMRPVALRGDAEVFSTRAWRIPLYSQPVNTASAASLLKSVLCGDATGCSVNYTNDRR
jgi:hypothetical protein